MKKILRPVLFVLAALNLQSGIFSTLKAAETNNSSPSAGKGSPKIQFATNFFDFGRITAGQTLSGEFEFKNTGDGVLKVDPPQASCDCTDPMVKPDTISPGETGKIIYTIKLERALNGQRTIRVHSNDPQNPFVNLTMQMDYTPLYELSPKTLKVSLAPGKDESHVVYTVGRADGKPLDVDRFTTSKEWITAALDPSFKPDDSSAKVNVTIHRPPGPPALINARIEMWSNNQSAHPVQTINLSGEVFGEVAAMPPRLYWVIPDFGKDKSAYPAEALTRKISLVSVLGHEVEVKSATSPVKGLNVQVLPREPKKSFDLVLKFDELPQIFTNAVVTVETTLASLPKLEVPVTISVPGAN